MNLGTVGSASGTGFQILRVATVTNYLSDNFVLYSNFRALLLYVLSIELAPSLEAFCGQFQLLIVEFPTSRNLQMFALKSTKKKNQKKTAKRAKNDKAVTGNKCKNKIVEKQKRAKQRETSLIRVWIQSSTLTHICYYSYTYIHICTGLFVHLCVCLKVAQFAQ